MLMCLCEISQLNRTLPIVKNMRSLASPLSIIRSRMMVLACRAKSRLLFSAIGYCDSLRWSTAPPLGNCIEWYSKFKNTFHVITSIFFDIYHCKSILATGQVVLSIV